MKNILVLTDFSNQANHAIDYACNLANKLLAKKMFLLNTYEMVPLYDSGEGGVLSLSMHQAAELELARNEEFERLKNNVIKKLNSSIELSAILLNANLTDAANEVCREKNIDLVVMGIKTKDGFEQILIGSHAQSAIEKIAYPLLIVPESAPITIPEKIILATNFYETTDVNAFNKLDNFLKKFKASLLAVHKYRKDEDRAATKVLADTLQLQLIDYDCRVEFIDSDKNLAEEINSIAKSRNASLLISLHKVRGFFAALFHRSTTKTIAWNSAVPLLVLHVE